MLADVGLFIAGFLFSCFIGTLSEYLVHVFMHRRLLFGKAHTYHHKSANGQGVWGEFIGYLWPSAPFLIALFCVDYWVLDALWLGIGTLVGGAWFCAFSAYTHQLSHERPEMIFWLRFPVHHIHHYHNMWRHNFGVTTLLWDRVFRTYKDVEWKPANRLRFVNFFRIHWISENPVEDYHKHEEVVIPESWIAEANAKKAAAERKQPA